MNAIFELKRLYVLFKMNIGSHQDCIDWAVERLQNDQDTGDFDIALLAAATKREEVLPLVEKVLSNYLDLAAIDEQFEAGKYVVSLYQAYRGGKETVESLDDKFSKLYCNLEYPEWLVMLSRNCEYATDIPPYLEPFEDEFEYIANLWLNSQTREEFESKYSLKISNQHDLK